MILLTDLILEINDVEERSVWTTYSGGRTSPKYGARNTFGEKRYFKNREDASKFARGEITTHAKGQQIAIKKVKPEKMDRKQKYDTKPVVKKDMEKIS
jgi:hypothetical protein